MKKNKVLKSINKFISKHKIALIFNLITITAIGVLLLVFSQKNQNQSINSQQKNITAEITGAVKKPGIYNFKKGAVVEDLIKSADGLSDQIDKEKLASSINRAEVLSDGQKVAIPILSSTQIAGASTSSSGQSQNIAGKVNINTASLAQLDTLPGIGPAYAQRITDYRNANNGFKSIEEIKNIKGIGDKTFEKLKDLISI